MLGRTVGHYVIEGKLGEGGMGVVYRARDLHLDRPVAIKVLRPDAVADPERRRRFVQEAKAASALNHANIITIYDIDTADGVDFIAMEYVAGRTLDQAIQRDSPGLPEVLKYAVQIADGLARAHAAGIIHRDLKPANIMVTSEGQVKLLDFGLAKLTEATDDERTISREGGTAEGVIMGTVAYMSPEQAQGKKLDARSDIFSFGAVLYEMVTGRRAFRGDSSASTLSAILRDEPAPPEAAPPDLQKLIARCLRKQPERRVQHMDDVKVALEDLKEESATSTARPAVAGARRRPWAAWTAALAGAMALAAVGWWLRRPASAPEPQVLAAVPLTSYPGEEAYPSFSPDGNQVAFSWDGEKQDNFDIYVKLVGPGTPLRLTIDPARDTSPVWSPDGRWIAFLRQYAGNKAELCLVPALGGPERKLADIRPQVIAYRHLCWFPDSQALIASDAPSIPEARSLFGISTRTGEKWRLTTAPAKQYGDSGPALSPDGRTLVFARAVGYGLSDLYSLSLSNDLRAASEPKRLTDEHYWIQNPVWTPDGRSVLFSGGSIAGGRSLWRLPMPAAAAGLAKPQRLTSAGESVSDVAVSARPQGARLVYVQDFTDANIWRVELAGSDRAAGPPAKFLFSTRREGNPQFSPDGKKVAFASNLSGQDEIWVCNADGSSPIQITTFGGPANGSPRWSPDGRQIVLDAFPQGHGDIYVVPAGGGEPRRLTDDPSDDFAPSWSQDGRWIYFGSNRTGRREVWKMPAGGGAATQVTREGSAGYASESADGRTVYYSKGSALWKVPAEGGEETSVFDGMASSQSFTVARDGIYFLSPRGSRGSARLEFYRFNGGQRRPILEIDKPVLNPMAVSPDGRWILYPQIDQQGADLMLVENFR